MRRQGVSRTSGFRLRNGFPLVIAASLAAVAVSAHDGVTGVVAERMRAMEAVAADVKVLHRTLKSESTVTADVHSRVMRIHAQAHDLLRHFPPGSDHGNTLARPEVWTQRDEFERLAHAYDEASGRLVASSAAGDLAETQRRFINLTRQCASCHRRFRASQGETRHNGGAH